MLVKDKKKMRGTKWMKASHRRVKKYSPEMYTNSLNESKGDHTVKYVETVNNYDKITNNSLMLNFICRTCPLTYFSSGNVGDITLSTIKYFLSIFHTFFICCNIFERERESPVLVVIFTNGQFTIERKILPTV